MIMALIVDDLAPHRLLIVRALKRCGIEISKCWEASTLQQALNHLSVITPDIALIDINLDGESGLEILKVIRSKKPLLDTPCIVVSTSNLPQDVEEAYRLGANCYIIKTEDPTEFIAHIGAAFRFCLLLS